MARGYGVGSADRVDEYLDAIHKFFTKKVLYPLTFLEPVGKDILESVMQKKYPRLKSCFAYSYILKEVFRMLDELEIAIKERIQERYDILAELYSTWFTKSESVVVPKSAFYQKEHIAKHRAITYLLDRKYIVADSVENDVEMVAITITPDGIDFYEQGYLSGKAKGFQVVSDVKNMEQ